MTINTRSSINYHGTIQLNNTNLSGIIVGAAYLTCAKGDVTNSSSMTLVVDLA